MTARWGRWWRGALVAIAVLAGSACQPPADTHVALDAVVVGDAPSLDANGPALDMAMEPPGMGSDAGGPGDGSIDGPGDAPGGPTNPPPGFDDPDPDVTSFYACRAGSGTGSIPLGFALLAGLARRRRPRQ